MSLSTTTTATYELIKYSRAYSQSTTAGSVQSELEWQHFANPVIRLTLDTKKLPEGRLESLRLRITWVFSAGINSMDVDQNEVVFEDLDLVTYSVMPSFQAPQGMPLKAVYQGAVVGLRYQHPRVAPPGQAPQYRRFQVAFPDEAAATAFIERIRFVCPCKANAGPPAARVPRPTQTQGRPQAPTASQVQPHIVVPELRAPASAPASGLRQAASTDFTQDKPTPPSTVGRVSTTLPPRPSITHNWLDTVCGSQYAAPRPDVGAPTLTSATTVPPAHAECDLSRPSTAATVSSAMAQHSSSEISGSVPAADSQFRAYDVVPPAVPSHTTIANHGSYSDAEISLPSSSFPSSSPPIASRPLPQSSPVLMPPPPLPPQASLPRPSRMTQTPASSAPPPSTAESTVLEADPSNTSISSTSTLKSDLDATLKYDAGLYKLPKEQLEGLVAEVIREEGFAELMRALDAMWKIKGLAGITA